MSKATNLTDFLVGMANKLRGRLGIVGAIDPQDFEDKIDEIPNEDDICGELLNTSYGDNDINLTLLNLNAAEGSAATIAVGETKTITLVADEGYSLPSAIACTGADCSYDANTGVATLTNPIGSVSITASGVRD